MYVTHKQYFLYTPDIPQIPIFIDVSESSMQNKARANSFEDYNILLSCMYLN